MAHHLKVKYNNQPEIKCDESGRAKMSGIQREIPFPLQDIGVKPLETKNRVFGNLSVINEVVVLSG
jgi:hypothetical protein